jgi:hypothetical protein
MAGIQPRRRKNMKRIIQCLSILVEYKAISINNLPYLSKGREVLIACRTHELMSLIFLSMLLNWLYLPNRKRVMYNRWKARKENRFQLLEVEQINI